MKLQDLLLEFLYFSYVIRSGHAARILLLPYGVFGHIRQLAFVGEELMNYGHEVYLVVPEAYQNHEALTGSGSFTIIPHFMKYKYIYSMDKKELAECFATISSAKGIGDRPSQKLNKPGCFGQNGCLNILEDEELFVKLKKLQLDLAIVGAVSLGRCALILPYNLGIPYASFTPMFEPWLSRNPGLPSTLPSNLFGKVFSEKMGFWERLENAWSMIAWVAWPQISYLEDSFTHRFIQKDKPLMSLNELAQRSQLWLVDQDMIIDYPRPTMPNEIYVGGLSLKPPKPLEGQMKEFMDGATDGVIVMSFGSNPFKMEPKILEKFFNSFIKVGIRVVMKNTVIPENVPENVLVETWIPQNDLLAHPNTKIFITHCGNNGQMEAIYHGVPMIGFPLFGDQAYNCHRLAYHNYGLYLNLWSFEENDLYEAITQILSNDTFKDSIKVASGIVRDRPEDGRGRARAGIEHILKHGAAHLRSHALDLPWYQYLMLDILLFLIVVCLALVLTIRYGIKYLYQKVSSHKFVKKD